MSAQRGFSSGELQMENHRFYGPSVERHVCTFKTRPLVKRAAILSFSGNNMEMCVTPVATVVIKRDA